MQLAKRESGERRCEVPQGSRGDRCVGGARRVPSYTAWSRAVTLLVEAWRASSSSTRTRRGALRARAKQRAQTSSVNVGA